MTRIKEEAPANFVPAAAVKRRGQVLFVRIGRKGLSVGESTTQYATDAEVRKHREQTGLETLVVYAVNYACSIL
eukprot:gene11-19_t